LALVEMVVDVDQLAFRRVRIHDRDQRALSSSRSRWCLL
jgi:hypothetical protein